MTLGSPCVDTGDPDSPPDPDSTRTDMGALFFEGRIIYIPQDYATIQEGINAAFDGNQVVVSPGIYHEHDIDFLGKEITVRSTDPLDPQIVLSTVVDADSLGNGFYLHTEEGYGSILSGMTIREGSAGGINIHGDFGETITPVISNCVLMSNYVYGLKISGFIHGYAKVTTTNCYFTRNYGNAAIYAGDAYPDINDCFIINNECKGIEINIVEEMAPAYNRAFKISNCVISNNSGGIVGGISYYHFPLAYRDLSRGLVIENSSIINNTGSSIGGIYLSDEGATANIKNCIIAGNHGARTGGIDAYLVWDGFILENCTISNNSADSDSVAGGVRLFDSNVTIINSILWGDSPRELDAIYSVPEITYSDIEGGWTGEGNIDDDPEFVDPLSGNFTLSNGSPCIDAGDPSFGVPFGGGCIIDMGALEYWKGYNCYSVPFDLQY